MITDIVNDQPDNSGYVQDGLGNNIGIIGISKSLNPLTEKSPSHTGVIEVDGIKYRVVLWKN